MRKLAVISSHPIQYYAPWFRVLSESTDLDLRVFYLWDFGIKATAEPEFGVPIQWDLDLLDGYDSEFVPNVSSNPGTSGFFGLRNPELLRRVLAWRPDAVLLIGYNHASMLDFILRWPTKNAPLLFRGDSHRLGTTATGWKERIRRALLSTIFRRFAGFLAVGKANANYFHWHGVPESRIFSAPHAVDNDRFQKAATPEGGARFRREMEISDDVTLILFVGKLVEKKRPHDLLEAFLRLADQNTVLVYAGEGPMREELQNRAASSEMKVCFAGFRNQTELPAIYAAADVLVLPSEGRWETWGLVVNEAMACGVPCIVSSHVGCAADLVLPGKTGWIFPATDVAALAECLRDAVTDPERRKEKGHASASHVLLEYNYQRACEGVVEALKGVIRT